MRMITFKGIAGNLLLAIFLQISCSVLSQDSFYQVLPGNAGKTQNLNFQGIPFKVIPTEKGFVNLASVPDPLIVTDHLQAVQAVFFLGIVTEKPEASAWWGPTERWYAFNNRLFIGDQLGKIFIVYRDTTVDVIPIIFGVNLWNYELLNKAKNSESYLNKKPISR